MAEETTNQDQETTIYEVAFHIDPNLSETEVGNVFDTVQKSVETAGGAVIAKGAPQRIALAYTISLMRESGRRNYDEAHFAWIAYEGTPDAQEDIEEVVAQNEHIIRHLIVKTTKEEALYAQDREAERARLEQKEAEDAASSDDLDEALEEATT